MRHLDGLRIIAACAVVVVAHAAAYAAARSKERAWQAARLREVIAHGYPR